jgi:uncharacterized protein YllA (UPF0747 family)
LGPHQAFRSSRHELSALADTSVSRTDINDTAVETSSTAFDQSSHDEHVSLASHAFEKLSGAIATVFTAFGSGESTVDPVIAGTERCIAKVNSGVEVFEKLIAAMRGTSSN